jgi:hypothetical protein
MKQTKHIRQRMSQRGVSQEMVNLVIEYGETKQDKHVLGRREALHRLEIINQEARVLKKIVDKGGVVVVVEGNALITTYNRDQLDR